VGRKALVQAAEQLGGMDALARRLGLSTGALRVYFMGSEPVPQQLFLRIVDVLQPSLQSKTPPKQ
jgi:AcrR family transcriptional regulator